MCGSRLIQYIKEEAITKIEELLKSLPEADAKECCNFNDEYCGDFKPLHWVTLLGESEVLKNIARLLLKYGANVNSQNIDGETPLLLAVEGKNYHMARLFIRYGAKNINATPNYIPTTPSSVYKAQGHTDDLFLCFKAKPAKLFFHDTNIFGEPVIAKSKFAIANKLNFSNQSKAKPAVVIKSAVTDVDVFYEATEEPQGLFWGFIQHLLPNNAPRLTEEQKLELGMTSLLL
jgi:ankyrin repeat protein